MIVLETSPVKFIEEPHSYWLGDKQLQGITAMITRHLFSSKYNNVPEEILAHAASKGSLVHKEIEDHIKSKEIGFTDEFHQWYVNKSYGRDRLAAEYLVSDNKNFATKIDIVQHTDYGYNLRDIKTTYNLDKNYLQWQLSICAYLFEIQTGLKVNKLYGDWVRADSYKEIELERISVDKVKSLLECELNGEMYQEKSLQCADSTIAEYVELSTIIQQMKAEVKETELKAKNLEQAIKDQMIEKNIKSIDLPECKITYVYPATRTSIDSRRLKKEMPEVAEKYSKTSKIADSIRITIKKDEEA